MLPINNNLKQNQPTPQYQPIAEFYAGKTVALTGGTGFLGQGIVEKLLYSCPDVKKIILLIRNKRGVTPEDRLKSLADKPVCFFKVVANKNIILQKKQN